MSTRQMHALLCRLFGHKPEGGVPLAMLEIARQEQFWKRMEEKYPDLYKLVKDS